jgi:type IV secretion system protein VirD4
VNGTGEHPPGDGFEIALVAVGGTVIGVGFVTWLGARIAVTLTGGHINAGLDVWVRTTVRLARGQTPSEAWGPAATGLPATWLYWTCTAIAFAAVAGLVAVGWWVWRRIGGDAERKRRRFGQDTDARQATARDVAPIVVDSIVPPEGRMLLGRMAGTKLLLATEDRNRHQLRGKAARRQGNRGSVALIGPTGSGKTALAASAIATWDGPVVAVSVKRDLYDTTAAARANKGQIAMFDPGGATGLPTARWSPLEAVTSSSGALRTGRALAQAIPRGGVTNADYWAKHGEKLLAAFMAVAGLARLIRHPDGTPVRTVSMEQVASWVTTMAIATDPAINDLLRRGLHTDASLEVKLMARYASTTFTGIAKEDHKIRSSIYSTAALALDPWLEPSVAHSATASDRPFYWSDHHWDHAPQFINLDWLVNTPDGRSNTLYLAASQPEFERLSPVLGGLLADLKDSIHAGDIAGTRLKRPLLFVIDEAGQLELGWLPAEVSTIAALGAFFVTCWQSLSQMQHRYTSLADAVLSGHRTKCFFAGVDDLATTRYLSTLLGSEHVTRRGWSHDVPSAFGGNRNAGRRSVSVSQQREEFAPANALRQMYPGEAVLLHGTLPPIHLDAVRWWKEPHLATLVPLTADGEPQPPDGLITCPLTDLPAEGGDDPVDTATLDSALAQLPEPTPQPTAARNAAPAKVVKAKPDDAQLDLFGGGVAVADPPAKRPITTRPTVERYSGRCAICHQPLASGEGQRDLRDGETIVRCAPSCTERKRLRQQAEQR